MLRRHDWNERLVGYASGVRGEPFRWGTTDCAYVVRGALRAMYGKDLLLGMGSYRTMASALRAARQVGPVGAFLRGRGFDTVKPNFAQSGDVVLFRGLEDGLPQLGVVVSGKLLVTTPTDGVELHRLPLGDWPAGVRLYRAPQA